MTEQAQPQSFVRKCYAKAEDLFVALMPTSELFPNLAAKRWVFRGQRDSKWRLVPTARRMKTEGLVWADEAPANQEQIRKEIDEVFQFFTIADQHGHALPEDSQKLRAILRQMRTQPDGMNAEYVEHLKDWPTNEVLSLVGLAQHHGMQTSLLDWTWNPLCAAYFAASSAVKKLRREAPVGCLSVWALSTSAMARGRFELEGIHREIELVTVPTATNANLHAQEGLFVHVHQYGEVDLSGEVNRDGLEHLIENGPFKSDGETLLYQLNLPVAEAPELLRLVGWLGASAGRFNPTLRGVVEELEESALVDRRGRLQEQEA